MVGKDEKNVNVKEKIFIEKLYKSLFNKMYYYSLSALGRPEIAEEAVQEAFRIACSRIKVLMKSENPEGWMVITQKNVIRNIRRSQAAYNNAIISLLAESAKSDNVFTDDPEQRAVLHEIAKNEEFIMLKMISEGYSYLADSRGSLQTDVLCKAANIYMCARAMGSEPDGMTEAQMKEVQDVFKLPKKRPC